MYSFRYRSPPLAALLGVVAAITAHAIETCYWPNGGNATEDGLIPCHGSRFPSVCCYGGGVCLSNGLCLGIDIGYFHRGACTDPTWDKTNCPQKQCFDSVSNQHANLMPCPTDPNGQWTCGGNGWSSDICRGSELWSFEKAVATPGVVQLPQNLEAAISSSWGASSTSPPESSGSSSTSPTPTTTQPSGSVVQSPQCTSGVSPSRVVAVGAGVGLGIGVPLLAMLAGVSMLYLRERRGNRAPKQMQQMQQMQQGNGQVDDPSGQLQDEVSAPVEISARRDLGPASGHRYHEML